MACFGLKGANTTPFHATTGDQQEVVMVQTTIKNKGSVHLEGRFHAELWLKSSIDEDTTSWILAVCGTLGLKTRVLETFDCYSDIQDL